VRSQEIDESQNPVVPDEAQMAPEAAILFLMTRCKQAQHEFRAEDTEDEAGQPFQQYCVVERKIGIGFQREQYQADQNHHDDQALCTRQMPFIGTVGPELEMGERTQADKETGLLGHGVELTVRHRAG
tara:strand:+ start:451 stop:834 length:384 start_codon:yes stop_codon:yes gene_type:complete